MTIETTIGDLSEFSIGEKFAPAAAIAAAHLQHAEDVKNTAEAIAGIDALLGNPNIRRVLLPDGKRAASTNGGTLTTWWKDGRLHRDHREGPALLETGLLGTYEQFLEHGKLHRPAVEGPAIRHLNPDGTARSEIYYRCGLLHRDPAEGPAHTERDPNTRRVTARDYFVDGKQVRCLRYHPDGSLKMDVWKRDGVMHRNPAEGPAAMWRAGCEMRTEYYVEGRCHRDPAEGPASIVRTFTGELIEVAYWVHGEKIRRCRSKRLKRKWRKELAAHERQVRRNPTKQEDG